MTGAQIFLSQPLPLSGYLCLSFSRVVAIRDSSFCQRVLFLEKNVSYATVYHRHDGNATSYCNVISNTRKTDNWLKTTDTFAIFILDKLPIFVIYFIDLEIYIVFYDRRHKY